MSTSLLFLITMYSSAIVLFFVTCVAIKKTLVFTC